MRNIEVSQLVQRILEHNHCTAFVNTIFAVYGISSRMGGYYDNHVNECSAWRYLLEADMHMSIPFERNSKLSPAAVNMEAAKIERNRGRKLPPTKQAVAAMIEYLEERQAILEDAISIMNAGQRVGTFRKALSKTHEHMAEIKLLLA
jgi:hypothetical protein